MSQTAPNQRVLLLQSGGLDSAAAALRLIRDGYDVLALTLSKHAAGQASLPQQRAEEIHANAPSYAWAMADITAWNRTVERHIAELVSDDVPLSCLTCILAKMTAAVPYCHDHSITMIALGYTDYQSDWTEQTPSAIAEQRSSLERVGISLLLPSASYGSKEEVKRDLIAGALTPSSLENPCCIAYTGTQPTPIPLTREIVKATFDLLESQPPALELIARVGGFPQ